MNQQLQNFLNFITTAKADLNLHRQVAFELECSESSLDILDKVIGLSTEIEEKSSQSSYPINYLNQFQSNINSILGNLPFRGQKDTSFMPVGNDNWNLRTKNQLEQQISKISGLYNQLEFNIDFFRKIGFFNNNVVAIGANGSGKTTLSNKFKSYLQNNGVVISAQRILLVPNFNAISNPTKTATDLKQYQLRDKTNKNDREFSYLQQEFAIVLKNLLADNIAAGNSYRKKAIELVKTGKGLEDPKPTNLDIAFEIWNSLIEHRRIECNDGVNITANSDDGRSYPAIQMSDGEKVMLYLIAQVLQAPVQGFIVVDEPEMYLHKTILKKLWDILESERSDCLFIYLTHDLDFATSRTTAKKIWIKSFTHPDKWEIEDIPTDQIPESLLFELLGSRKNILFCEGVKGSIDERVYSTLFPELTIMPVGSCFDVINHTKAFNKLSNVTTKAFGIIDSDHHDSERLEKLEKENIYSFKIAEVENLFLDIDFLNILASQLLVDTTKINEIKTEVINELSKLKEIQASNYVSAKINYFFTDSDVSKGNKLEQVEENYADFLSKISISDWYNNRITELEQIISTSDYLLTITTFNNKGLKGIASKHFKISDFTERSIKLLQSDINAQNAIIKYFPEEIKTVGNNVYKK
jgi:ABC-type cobalamin/Fe3+-siderophores transport system ATPase subunit